MNSLDEQITALNRQGKFNDLIVMLENILPTTSPIEDKIRLKIQLGEAYYSARDFQQAKRVAEEILQKIGQKDNDILYIAEAENILGKVYRIYQHYDEAIIHYRKAEKMFKEINNTEGLSKIYHNLGNVYVLLEQFKKAQKYHNIALNLANQTKNEYSIASSHLNIGSLNYQNGEVNKALNHFELAKELLEKLQDKPTLSAALVNLAEIYVLRREFDKASLHSSKAVSLYKEQNNIIGQRLALSIYAKAEKAKGSFEKATEILNEIIELDPSEVTEETYLELGKTYLALNQLSNAKKIFEKILTLPNRTLQGIGYSLDYLARIAIDNRDFNEARKIYTQLLKVLYDIEPRDNDSIASIQGNLGFMYLKTGNFDRAWEFLDYSVKYLQKRKDFDELFTLTNNYLNDFILINEFDQAIKILSDYIIPAVKKSKRKNDLNQYHYNIALIHHLNGQTDDGLQYWDNNFDKKIPFQKINPLFLKIPNLDKETKKKLENQHYHFLKRIRINKIES